MARGDLKVSVWRRQKPLTKLPLEFAEWIVESGHSFSNTLARRFDGVLYSRLLGRTLIWQPKRDHRSSPWFALSVQQAM